MTRIERRLVARFSFLTAKLLLVLGWLTLVVQLPRVIALARFFDPDRALALGLRFFGFLEVGLVFAAPLAVTAVLLDLGRSGLLATLLANGLGMRHLRRALLVAAAVATLAATAGVGATSAIRASYLARRSRRGPFIVRDGASYLWVIDRIDREVLGGDRRGALFAADSLDVALVDRVKWEDRDGAFSLAPPRAVAGRVPPARTRFEPTGEALDAFLPPASSWWALRATLAWINRTTLAGALAVLAGYVSLLVPLARPRRAYVLLAFGFPAAGLGAFWCTTLLWTHERLGVVVELAWILVLGAAIALLDRAFARRGLRAA